jgi:hypothetical protein
MDKLRSQLPFRSIFMSRKFLQMLYLIVSPGSVFLKDPVMLARKIRHFFIGPFPLVGRAHIKRGPKWWKSVLMQFDS